MLALEPGAPDSQDRPATADVVDGDDRLRDEAGVPEGVGADEQTQPDPGRRLRQGGHRGVTLVDRLFAVAEDRQEMVPGPEVLVAELLGSAAGREE